MLKSEGAGTQHARDKLFAEDLVLGLGLVKISGHAFEISL